MKGTLRDSTWAGFLLALFVLLLAGAGLVSAQTGGDYDLSWWTVDSGGADASGGGYNLSGTPGQPEPAPLLIGGGYRLIGGFWPGATGPGHKIYLPVILRHR